MYSLQHKLLIMYNLLQVSRISCLHYLLHVYFIFVLYPAWLAYPAGLSKMKRLRIDPQTESVHFGYQDHEICECLFDLIPILILIIIKNATFT